MLSAACELASASQWASQWIHIISPLCLFNLAATSDRQSTHHHRSPIAVKAQVKVILHV